MEELDQITKVTSWDSGGGVLLDLVHLKDGKVLAISDEIIVLYSSEDDLVSGEESVRPSIAR